MLVEDEAEYTWEYTSDVYLLAVQDKMLPTCWWRPMRQNIPAICGAVAEYRIYLRHKDGRICQTCTRDSVSNERKEQRVHPVFAFVLSHEISNDNKHHYHFWPVCECSFKALLLNKNGIKFLLKIICMIYEYLLQRSLGYCLGLGWAEIDVTKQVPLVLVP